MKGMISFLKMWITVLLGWVMPVRGSLEKMLKEAGRTYEQRAVYSGGVAKQPERNGELMLEYRRVLPADAMKERGPDVCKKTSRRVRAGPELYMIT
ncbi:MULTISPECIES: hypothetical protein [Bacillus]|uniref:Uncharacterized protein n=1 Tax=Bacillus glycinifermentans TaxID=1664069 RepID=A0AAJ3Z291_9BACI|nr:MULTISPECIES: hypothetical protein [Bacillus]KKB73917.1 hypothetical protein TH62_09575 [Bacillus sp. TH008]MDU0072519.1 hypothetical protein [Bacillus sp. IG6]MED8020281.1 hypothetical protein [Bacillus glycinifermentans]QAT67443.1 hypothetical protein EQZ20_22865 [Bacillus glycinifermentans]WKB77091.1 hypothetical protein QYM22_22590 [Bacillus glycinifermentans]